MFTVNYWGSNPDEENDDCWSGDDFETLEEARACFDGEHDRDVAFIQLCETVGSSEPQPTAAPSEGVYEVRANPRYRKRALDDGEWRREMAMEAGMLHGVEAYNEEMGWD